MTKLTEEMVFARTRQSSLDAIVKFNCWGADLSDVSVCRKFRNCQVLSLSVNQISTLEDFQNLPKLQELFIRKNNIQHLSDIIYLKSCPSLHCLWLDENPCAEHDNYRLTVIRNLPNLKKLDNVEITPDEKREAARRGHILQHPDLTDTSPEESETEDVQYQRSQIIEEQSRPSPESEDSPSRDRDIYEYQPAQEQISYTNSTRYHSSQNHSLPEENNVGNNHHSNWGSRQGLHKESSSSEGSPTNGHRYIPNYSSQEESYVQTYPKIVSHSNNDLRSQEILSRRASILGRRSASRTSNIMSAVMHLVSELDYSDLVVLEAAIRSRLDKMDQDSGE
ncbi:unnamed protein product [Bemisia tabaci]|uniref:U2A'/phosphoprotein 32 family A C-terminal domain-containing protein n=1 Tax=Bemisia tabaci TaxID=7038 RepID=A0A9P0G522_BEMTA|nr:PREDICTED: uncharacterized protein F09G8.5-like [Bemisia tabaci]CAH0777718.1 unnamed protein product [Bemisia tabaci]